MSSASMPMPLASGYVSFDDAPRVRVSRPAAPAEDGVAERSSAADAAAVAPASAGLLQSPSWQPASSGRVRMVEGAVIAALCGWFFYGGLAVLGWV
jgi:hypothetical protein